MFRTYKDLTWNWSRPYSVMVKYEHPYTYNFKSINSYIEPWYSFTPINSTGVLSEEDLIKCNLEPYGKINKLFKLITMQKDEEEVYKRKCASGWVFLSSAGNKIELIKNLIEELKYYGQFQLRSTNTEFFEESFRVFIRRNSKEHKSILTQCNIIQYKTISKLEDKKSIPFNKAQRPTFRTPKHVSMV